MSRAVIVAARRTPVAPRGGAFSALQADELAAPVMQALLRDANLDAESIDQVFLGNALYGGGNPARMAALRAGLPVSTPSLTIDTQCCSGLDGIILGARMIESGAATCVLAGGAESFSRAPVRMHCPIQAGTDPIPYSRPPFAPPPFSDPDLTQAAADLAERIGISRVDQAEYAVQSHAKARQHAADIEAGLAVPDGTDIRSDSFTRNLNTKTALKAPVISGSQQTGLSAATIACEADAAAMVLLVSKQKAQELGLSGLEIDAAMSTGGDPADPALVPNKLALSLLERAACDLAGLNAVELHEAYAVQALQTQRVLSIPDQTFNPMGGGLARGHPIAASGAVLMYQIFQRAACTGYAEIPDEFRAMALIAAAGGLASGIIVRAPLG